MTLRLSSFGLRIRNVPVPDSKCVDIELLDTLMLQKILDKDQRPAPYDLKTKPSLLIFGHYTRDEHDMTTFLRTPHSSAMHARMHRSRNTPTAADTKSSLP